MNKYLLPNKYRVIGFILLLIGLMVIISKTIFKTDYDFLNATVFAIITGNLFGLQFFKFENHNLIYPLTTIILFFGATLIATTKEKEEQSHYNELRAESIILTFHIILGIVTFSFLFIHGFALLYLLIFFLFLPQLMYYVIFQIKKRKSVIK